MLKICILILLVNFFSHSTTSVNAVVEVEPNKLEIILNETRSVNFRNLNDTDLVLNLHSSPAIELTPKNVPIINGSGSVQIRGVELISRAYVDVANCSSFVNGSLKPCPFEKEDVFIRVEVMKSYTISLLITITGWIYFVAWSVSFWPQICLNFQRKSVCGLNFDFLFLNVIGFACYTIYNVLMFFDPLVQQIYISTHGNRSVIPVLLNDVVFAIHAFTASFLTGVQCLIYERGNQRISKLCYIFSSILLIFAAISFVCTFFGTLNLLQFINHLAYVKMAVTCSKYFPQAILNWKRKSTTGWSIGNVLLDGGGGLMAINQMILQAINTSDWSAFYGNPVKFGLGMISIVFDVIFIVQHFILYPEKKNFPYGDVSNVSSAPDLNASSSSSTEMSENVDAALNATNSTTALCDSGTNGNNT